MEPRRAAMADLGTVAGMTDVGAEAAEAARRRWQRLDAPAPLEPCSTDFEAFRAKAMGRSQRYARAAERSRKQGEAATTRRDQATSNTLKI